MQHLKSALILWSLLALLTMSGPGYAAPLFWDPASGGNGHWYEVITVPGEIVWSTANATANAGGGYLATITSSPENDFVAGLPGWGTSNIFWLGGVQAVGYGPSEGWSWVTGEPWGFTNWWSGEPNDAGGDERHLQMWSGTLSERYGAWNDGNGYKTAPGFVVEYASNPVPEPSTLLLFASGFAGLAAFRLRKRAKGKIADLKK